MIDVADIEANLQKMTSDLATAGGKDFEDVWKRFLHLEGADRLAFMRTIFESFYVHAFTEGGTKALVMMLEAIARQRQSCP